MVGGGGVWYKRGGWGKLDGEGLDGEGWMGKGWMRKGGWGGLDGEGWMGRVDEKGWM